jgi:hypothetical protein
MKPKMHYQVQPREIAAPRSAPVVQGQLQMEQIPKKLLKDELAQEERVQEEIQSFLQALDSYPAQVAREPNLSFHEHLNSLFAARNDSDRSRSERRDNRTRRQ